MFPIAAYLGFSTFVLWMVVEIVLAPGEGDDQVHSLVQQKLAEEIEGRNVFSLFALLVLASIAVIPMIIWVLIKDLYHCCSDS